MTTETVMKEVPSILAGMKQALGVLFYASDVGDLRFWLHVLVGLVVLSLAGKIFMRWVGNVETRWFPLTCALLVPLLAWILAWAAADVWLAHRWADTVNPLIIKHLCAAFFGLLFAYFVILWSDAITRTHALVALVLTYVCFGLSVYGADLGLRHFAKDTQAVAAEVEHKA